MSKSTKKGAEFLCHVRFKNTLPDPDVDYKLIDVAPDLTSFTGYTPTDLERDYQYEMPASLLQTPLVDFVDLEALKPQMNEILPVEDEPLLVSFDVLERKRKALAEARAASEQDQSIESHVSKPAPIDSRRPEVTWLRRTEYISSEFGKSGTKKNAGEQTNSTIAHTKLQVKLETADDLVEAVESGFEPISLEELVHPTKPGIRAVEYLPIEPALDTTGLGIARTYTQCLFDVDPRATHGLGDIPIRSNADTSAILRAMSNPTNPTDSFVWYYLYPDAPTEPNALVYTRDYDIQRNDKPGQSFVLVVDESQQPKRCKYIPVTAQFHLRKRRLKAGEQPRQPHLLKVTRRPLDS